MRRVWALGLCVLAVLLLSVSPAAAAYDPDSPEDLKSAGWKDYETGVGKFGFATETVTFYCKTLTQVDDEDRVSIPFLEDAAAEEASQKFIDHYSALFEGTEHEADNDSDYAMPCVVPEDDKDLYFCIGRNRELPQQSGWSGDEDLKPECWDKEGSQLKGILERLGNTAQNPIGTALGDPIGEFATSLGQGVRWFVAIVLYWWILIPHAELGESGALALWPYMRGTAILVGTVLLIGQGIRMMVTSESTTGIVVSTVKGLAVFAIVCASAVPVLDSVIGGAESMTHGFLEVALSESEAGCSRYQSGVGQPDGMELDFPELETQGEQVQREAELATAFGHCAAANLYAGGASAGLLLLLYIVAFVMTLLQAVMLLVREAALPLMALMLPVAAAGQIGFPATRRWLPGLLALVLTVVLYKPMMAIVFAAGFTGTALSADVMNIVYGMLTLTIGVVVPAVMMKAFKPLMSNLVENGPSMGSALNNVFLATQAAGSFKGIGEKMAQSRATQASRQQAAAHAAHQGGGPALTLTKKTGGAAAGQAASTAAATASGPVGWAAKVGQFAGQALGSLMGKGAGAEQAGQAAGQAGQHLPTRPPAAGQGGQGGPQNSGINLRQPGAAGPGGPPPGNGGPPPGYGGPPPGQGPGGPPPSPPPGGPPGTGQSPPPHPHETGGPYAPPPPAPPADGGPAPPPDLGGPAPGNDGPGPRNWPDQMPPPDHRSEQEDQP